MYAAKKKKHFVDKLVLLVFLRDYNITDACLFRYDRETGRHLTVTVLHWSFGFDQAVSSNSKAEAAVMVKAASTQTIRCA